MKYSIESALYTCSIEYETRYQGQFVLMSQVPVSTCKVRKVEFRPQYENPILGVGIHTPYPFYYKHHYWAQQQHKRQLCSNIELLNTTHTESETSKPFSRKSTRGLSHPWSTSLSNGVAPPNTRKVWLIKSCWKCLRISTTLITSIYSRRMDLPEHNKPKVTNVSIVQVRQLQVHRAVATGIN